jgi:hypothetical protein
MSYIVKVIYERPSLDVPWFTVDTDFLNDADTEARASIIMEFLNSKSDIVSGTIQTSDDGLTWAYVQTFADEATYNTFKAEWDDLVANSLDGISPSQEPPMVDWMTRHGCTHRTEYQTI